ncbi:MAG TPA: DegT/DnrJ/EryC1/StrS family aminotransferase, partial [Sedimentisphaerales bacterium]|nr:DegT/DnrJ/EryC1/StrS family aminotransferase [Sedimentisphaerales bacterium]
PVFVDIDPVTMNLDYTKIEEKITDKTKAILPIEAFGNPTHFDKYREIARKHNLYFIEDSCEALGSALNGKKAGAFGDISFYAFYPNKQITTGEGGMIITDNDEWADMCVSLRNQGRGVGGGWLSHARLGYNFRLSDINCALGIVQLSRLEEIKAKRKAVAAYYQQLLADEDRLIVPTVGEGVDMSWFVFVVRIKNITLEKRQIMKDMLDEGIQVSNYFAPVHLQPFMVDKFGYKPGDFPVTDATCNCTVALPFHNNLSKDDAELVCDTLKKVLDKNRV